MFTGQGLFSVGALQAALFWKGKKGKRVNGTEACSSMLAGLSAETVPEMFNLLLARMWPCNLPRHFHAWQNHFVQRLSFTTDAGCSVFLVQNGEKWEEGPCTECECRDAEVTCFQHSCPPCPLGSLAVEVKGDCCPHCEPGTDPRSIVSYRRSCWVGA